MFLSFISSRTRHEYAAVGPKVNLAARLMQAAEGREPPILCDAETVDAAKETFKFTPCTPIHVKGKEYVIVNVYLFRAHYRPEKLLMFICPVRRIAHLPPVVHTLHNLCLVVRKNS